MHAGIQQSHTHTVGDEGSLMMVMWLFKRIDAVTLAVISGERYSMIIASKGWRCLCEEL